ncbi:MAG TPA: GNAT family N-acetyltransferase [Fimbriimonas sp.]|nr:GNAT family N-acetyltransferase [Fimbriimonas sp.]
MYTNPQLRMVHRLASVPAPRDLPDGYSLRRAADSDTPALARLLSTAFDEEWSEARVREVLLDNPEVPLTFVVDREGEPVAVASYQLKPAEFPESGYVHYVGVAPEHGGRSLGYIVSYQVVLEAIARGNKDVMLTTDDFRLPAIRTYLNLGFEPDIWHESHGDRWKAIYDKLESCR